MAGLGKKILGFLSGGFGEGVVGLASKFIKDKDQAEQFAHEYQMLVQGNSHEAAMVEADIEKTVIEQRGKVISTEAASKHWLAANWRPLTMLTFVVLIVARMFGFTAESVTEAEYIKLWTLVQIGLGGYVIGRSCEKLAPSVVQAIKGR